MIAMSEQRLRWMARRGMLELDHLFNAFIDTGYADLTAEEKSHFVVLLDQQDPLLYAWFFTEKTPDNQALKKLVQKIQQQYRGESAEGLL